MIRSKTFGLDRMKSSAPTIDPSRVGRNKALKYFAVFGMRFQNPIAPANEPGQRATEFVALATLEGRRNPTVRVGKVMSEPPPATALMALASAPRQNKKIACGAPNSCRFRVAPGRLPVPPLLEPPLGPCYQASDHFGRGPVPGCQE